MKESDLDLIDRFLLGRCNESERAAIQERIGQDALFAQQVREIQALQKAGKASSMRSKFDLLAQFENELSQNSGGKPPASRRKMNVWIGVAASFIVLIWVVNHFFAGDSNSPLESFSYSLSTDLVMRNDEITNLAYQLYELERYDEAAPQLQELAKEEPTKPHSLYAARSYILSGNLNDAQEMLDLTAQNVPGVKDHLSVNQAMLYLMQQDTSRALNYMINQYPNIEKMTNFPGEYYRFILAHKGT